MKNYNAVTNWVGTKKRETTSDALIGVTYEVPELTIPKWETERKKVTHGFQKKKHKSSRPS